MKFMNDCLSEVSYNLTTEESRESSCSFASRERIRSFLRTTPAPVYSWGTRYVQPSPVTAGFGLASMKTKKGKRNRMDRYYYVYILSNKSNKVLYTGVTNDLLRRVYEHKNKHVKGFSSKYNLSKLVYYEEAEDIYGAITREKQIKGYVRAKKIKLIESMNSEWKDL